VKGISSPYLENDENIQSLSPFSSLFFFSHSFLPSEIAERLEKLEFVGRDISNFAINLFKAGTGTGEGKELTEEVCSKFLTSLRNNIDFFSLSRW
jgi:hypothetical protein